MKKHPNKHIRDAIEFALQNGWEIVPAGKSAHAFCRLRCVKKHTEHSNECVEHTEKSRITR